jgi:hypothetical protein
MGLPRDFASPSRLLSAGRRQLDENNVAGEAASAQRSGAKMRPAGSRRADVRTRSGRQSSNMRAARDDRHVEAAFLKN